MICHNNTTVEFYEGVYGPTIMISVQDREWLLLFLEVVRQLESNEISELDIAGFKEVEKLEIGRLDLIMGPYTSLRELPLAQDQIAKSFTWTVDTLSIDWIIGGIELLLSCDEEGHYYFYEGKEMTIVLSYKEISRT